MRLRQETLANERMGAGTTARGFHCSGRCGLLALGCMVAVAARAHTPVTPDELDRFDAQKTSAVLPDGERLVYLDVGLRDGSPLVLIHGYTDSARDWAPLVPLMARRFRLIVVDLRGHGASSKPECCYTRFDFAYDVKLLLDALHIKRADIVGHSLGSIVAQTFAEAWPAATQRLILVSSTGAPLAASGGRCTLTGAQQSGLDLAALAELKDPIDPDSAFMRDWWKESIRINPAFFSSRQRRDAAAIPAGVWRAIADQSLICVDFQSMLPRIRASTLLIWGARDPFVVGRGHDALIAGIARAQVKTFASLGHDLLWEDPQAVADVMIGFLAQGE